MDYFNENEQQLQNQTPPPAAPPVPGNEAAPVEPTGYTEFQEPQQAPVEPQPQANSFDYGTPVQPQQQANSIDYGTPVQPQQSAGSYDQNPQSGSYSYSNDNYQQVYQQPSTNSGTSIASLVLGILSLVLCCCGPIGMILGIIGLILALVSKKGKPFQSLALAGLITSGIGIVLGLIMTILYFNNDYSYYGGYNPYEIQRWIDDLD
ncbi:MAG: hypothetical protein Q4D52_00660 [Eubacteriales bacterium]|nr:hypothetical protein [Eubacteriales bacterium]